MRRATVFLLAALVTFTAGIPSAHARGTQGPDGDPGQPSGGNRPTEPGDSITWWCLDLNNFWQVDIPVIVGRATLDYAYAVGPSIPDPGCGSPWPVVVRGASRFTTSGLWTMNHTYPARLRERLAADGYPFHSQSPAEDFLSKVVRVRIEVRTRPPENTLVAEYSFDAHKFFRRTLQGFHLGMLPSSPMGDPDLGIDISAAAARRLPSIGFPVPAGPIPEGTPGDRYLVYEYWTLSAPHNDGLGLDEGNFLPAGEFAFVNGVRFDYVP